MRACLILLLSGIAWCGWAQSFYNNGNVFISQGTTLSVRDSLVNNGSLTNNGNMVMGGVWLNLGTYNAGVGEITFNSLTGATQIINHNNQTFSKLTISGGGEKIILADMTIDGELVLSDGIITQQNNSRIILNASAVITGGSDNSHIQAPVYASGTGDKLFPIGNGTTYLPVQLLGIGTPSEVGVSLVEFTSPQSFAFKPELSDVSEKRYWQLFLSSGSLSGAQISLPVKGDEGLLQSKPLDDFVVVQSADAPIEFVSLGQSDFIGSPADGRIVSNLDISANLISIGLLSEDIVVYNAISANDDLKNAIMKISNITAFPNNKVTLFNRWGDKVFEVKGYDNVDNAFRGVSNVGGNTELPPGTYFYLIDKGDGSPVINGYISLKR